MTRPARPRALRALLAAALLLSLALPASAASPSQTVYTTTNADGPNELVVLQPGPGGGLTEVARLPTGGAGTGAAPGSQGAVITHRRLLFAVNPGSDSVSAFSLRGRVPVLADTAASGGVLPVSVTAWRDLLYVLNADGGGSISGFRIGADGSLSPLPGSTRPLSGAVTTAAAQIAFTPDGATLVVTERATDAITTFPVAADGLPSAPIVTPSAGATPFGFDVDRRGRVYVSEAFGGAADASAVSSYAVGADGSLAAISPSVGTTETAACWVVVTRDGRYLYTTNTGSGTVSGYRIGTDGSLTLLDADGVTVDTGEGSAPADAAISGNGRVLHVLERGDGEIGSYAIGTDGGLTPDGPAATGLPASALGLATG